jgi:FMN phosphatase YigB (HAD superfamily)
MFFDDSKEHIEPAKELGINAYHYQDFKEFKEIIEPILNKEKAEIN